MKNGPFKCCCCGRLYKYRKNLFKHMKYECGKEPGFSCPHCSYKSKQKSNLKCHIAIQHTHLKSSDNSIH